MRLNGLSSREVERSRKEYGLNEITQMPSKPFMQRFLGMLKEPFMLVAAAAFAVQCAVFFMGHLSWLIPVETLAALVILCSVSAVAESKNETSAKNAFDEDKTKQSVKVVRDGNMMEVQFNQVVVGDMILLQNGDKIAADGEIVWGKVKVDSSLLGGDGSIDKMPAPDRIKNYDTDDPKNRYYVHRGDVVTDGEAYMYVKAVGDKTLYGKNALHSGVKKRKMPKISFGRLLTRKAFFGYAFVFFILTAVLLSSLHITGMDIYKILVIVSALLAILGAVGFFTAKGVKILTEGYIYGRIEKFLDRNIFIRDVGTFTKTGKIKAVLADKTGVFTDGRFSVNEVSTGDGEKAESLKEVSPTLLKEICISTGMNNSSNSGNRIAVGGEKTDRAILSYLISADVMDTVIRQKPLKLNGYDVEKRYAYAVSADGDVYIKGNAESIINMCEFFMCADGTPKNIDKQKLLAYVSDRSEQGCRVIASAKSCDGDKYMLICVMSLKDGMNSDISGSVQECHAHFIMLTSDTKKCAFAAAHDAGFISDISEVKDISEVTEENISNIKVIAEVLPADKVKVLEMLQNRRIKTAVIAGSVYDIPMMKKADLVIAFQSASDTAKNAADIIILDDRVSSLKKIIK